MKHRIDIITYDLEQLLIEKNLDYPSLLIAYQKFINYNKPNFALDKFYLQNKEDIEVFQKFLNLKKAEWRDKQIDEILND